MSKLVKGAGKIATAPFKAIHKINKSILSGLKKGYKSLTSTTFGKALLIGATIYLGGAAFGMWNSPFSAINGVFASPAAAELGASTATAASEAGGSLAAGVGEGATAGGGEVAAAETLGGSTSIPSASEVAKEMANSSITMGGGAPSSAGVYADATGATSKGIINSAMRSAPGATPWYQKDLVQYGALMAGAGALQGAFTPNALDVADRQAELERENLEWRNRFLDKNFQVSSLNLGMSPSGQPVRDANGSPIYSTQPVVPGQPGRPVVPTPPRGIINHAMLRSALR